MSPFIDGTTDSGGSGSGNVSSPATNPQAAQAVVPSGGRDQQQEDFDQLGRTFIRVLAVYVTAAQSRQPEGESDIYGTVTIGGSHDFQHLYLRQRDNCERLGPDNRLTLNKTDIVSAADSFAISLNLQQRRPDLPADDEISSGIIYWNAYDGTNVYDEVQSRAVEGKNGAAARVDYVVMSNAAEAHVKILPLCGDDEQICGKIEAETEHGQSILFQRGQRDRERRAPDQPLLRDKIAVAMHDVLKLHMSLYPERTHMQGSEQAAADDDTSDDTTEGVLTFTPRLFHSERRRFGGPFGEVEVQVAWF